RRYPAPAAAGAGHAGGQPRRSLDGLWPGHGAGRPLGGRSGRSGRGRACQSRGRFRPLARGPAPARRADRTHAPRRGRRDRDPGAARRLRPAEGLLMPGGTRATRARVIAPQRRNSPLALAVLLAVWAGLMVLVLAPTGTFGPTPAAAVSAGALR